MAATNWTIIKREKATNQIEIYNLDKKWTYKTAIGYRDWETNKMMLKNEKENKNKTDI